MAARTKLGRLIGDPHQPARDSAAGIARGLSAAVGDQVARLLEAGAFPEDWDGHEVRALLAQEFAREVSDLMRHARANGGRRWRRFLRAAAEGMARRHEIDR